MCTLFATQTLRRISERRDSPIACITQHLFFHTKELKLSIHSTWQPFSRYAVTRALLTRQSNSETGSFPHTGRFMTTSEILRVVCEHLCRVCTKPDLVMTYDPNRIYPQRSKALPFRPGRLPFLKSNSILFLNVPIQNFNGNPPLTAFRPLFVPSKYVIALELGA